MPKDGELGELGVVWRREALDDQVHRDCRFWKARDAFTGWLAEQLGVALF